MSERWAAEPSRVRRCPRASLTGAIALIERGTLHVSHQVSERGRRWSRWRDLLHGRIPPPLFRLVDSGGIVPARRHDLERRRYRVANVSRRESARQCDHQSHGNRAFSLRSITSSPAFLRKVPSPVIQRPLSRTSSPSAPTCIWLPKPDDPLGSLYGANGYTARERNQLSPRLWSPAQPRWSSRTIPGWTARTGEECAGVVSATQDVTQDAIRETPSLRNPSEPASSTLAQRSRRSLPRIRRPFPSGAITRALHCAANRSDQ